MFATNTEIHKPKPLTNKSKMKMTLKKTVNLMLKSSSHNPYTGVLSKKDNLIAAIDLAKLCKGFADKGQADEAMNLDGKHWQQTIDKLQSMHLAL